MQAKKWVLLIALVIAGISCNAGQTKSEVLIKNDGGGDIPQLHRQISVSTTQW